MTEAEYKKLEEESVHLKYFGIPKLLPHLKPYRRMIIFMMLIGAFSTLGDVIMPLFQRYSINHYIAENTIDTLPFFIILYIAVLLIKVFCGYNSSLCCSRLEMYIGRDLKQKSFDHVQTLSFSYFNQNSVGYIHSRIMSDSGRIGGLVSWEMMDAVYNTTYFVGAIAVMLSINPLLTLFVVLVIPLVVIISAVLKKKLSWYQRVMRHLNSKITGSINEGITGAKTMKTLVCEDKMISEYQDETEDMKRHSVKEAGFHGLLWGSLATASYVALAAVLWYGGHITLEQLLEIGTLSIFMSYAMGIMGPIQWVVSSISNLITVQVNIERITKLLETESDVADSAEITEKYGDMFHPKKENWEDIRGDIEFEDVSFKYPDGEEYVLNHFNLKIPFGTNVAIVGETGAGKSTLVNLVCRFFEPTQGRVLIDGRDARERSQLWLHSHIGYVLQTPHLFSGTIRDNLRYGAPDATDEEIMEALRIVSADKIIAKNEAGLDTQVGEGGDLLSTGEKQLISFARAIIADPRILVLDEATSSIDTFTEQLIQNAITTVIAGRTSFVIAHRLSTIREADIILVVKNGTIIESGTHAELMKMKGYYHSLYTTQYEREKMNALLGAREDA
ncbi:MAG: ABC transporter ATP-binding protein/permease [Clostridia bacterium]|nr:ABC transporter ATP-binding protein/permease [Clostridia bacterium]